MVSPVWWWWMSCKRQCAHTGGCMTWQLSVCCVISQSHHLLLRQSLCPVACVTNSLTPVVICCGHMGFPFGLCVCLWFREVTCVYSCKRFDEMVVCVCIFVWQKGSERLGSSSETENPLSAVTNHHAAIQVIWCSCTCLCKMVQKGQTEVDATNGSWCHWWRHRLQISLTRAIRHGQFQCCLSNCCFYHLFLSVLQFNGLGKKRISCGEKNSSIIIAHTSV